MQRLRWVVPFFIRRIYRYAKYEKALFIRSENQYCSRKKGSFFVMYREVTDIGMGSQIALSLYLVEYARSRGYIPAIYRKFETNAGYINQWDICFNSLVDVDLSSELRGENTIICNKDMQIPLEGIMADFWVCSYKKRLKYRNIFNEFFVLNDDMKRMVDAFWNENFKPSDKVIGVLLRGTDYNETVAFNHPRQPKTDEAASVIKKLMKDYSCNKIFVATEDATILSDMINLFGSDKLYYVKQERFVREDRKTINCLIRENDVDKVSMLKAYICAIFTLGNCAGIVAGNTSASQFLPLLRDKYEFMYRFDLGSFSEGNMSDVIF